MNDVDTSVHDKIAGVHHAPGFLLTPFGWAAEPLAALVHAEPSLLTDLFAISRPRMHLIGLGLAHLNPPVPADIGPLLLRGLAWQVLDRVLGHRPAGLKRALGRLPVAVLQPENYRRLIDLLADSDAARVLRHADQIDDLAIRVLADLPLRLRRPLAFAVPDWRCRLDGLADGLQFLVSRGVAANLDAVVARLATVTAWPQLAAVVDSWVGMLPLPETIPPGIIGNARRLDNVEQVTALGRAWRNCLGTYGSGIDAGDCAVYLWEAEAERPAACRVGRHGRLGWFLDEVKGPRNSEIEPEQLKAIGAAFAGVGIPGSRVVSAIENIIWWQWHSAHD